MQLGNVVFDGSKYNKEAAHTRAASLLFWVIGILLVLHHYHARKYGALLTFNGYNIVAGREAADIYIV